MPLLGELVSIVGKYLFILFFGIALYLSINLPAKAFEPGQCVSRHIGDAISINTERKKLYKTHFGKQASSLISRLIWLEKVMLVPAYLLDKKARPYHAYGILFCQDLVSMSMVPAFSAQRVFMPNNETVLSKQAIKVMIKSIKGLLRKDVEDAHFSFTNSYLKQQIAILSSWPHSNCLARHFLESMLQVLGNAYAHNEKAKELSLPPSLPLSRKFVLDHLLGLPFMARLDRQAFELQKRGIPIFCQDIPPISH